MPIPDFCDGYHLPPGEHICAIEEIEQRFATGSDQRVRVWRCFRFYLDRCRDLGVIPSVILVDGSFVTGRERPGDVDAAACVSPGVILDAIDRANEHDRLSIRCLLAPPAQHPSAADVRNAVLGADVFVVPDLQTLGLWSEFFRCGANGKLREPDPDRDPAWVTRPAEKGILRVEFLGGVSDGRH